MVLSEMDIFKLIYEHDLRLDNLRERHTDRHSQDLTLSIEEFMKPDPTYSKFYITGSKLNPDQFGLNRLDHFDKIIGKLETGMEGFRFFTADGECSGLMQLLDNMEIWQAAIISRKDEPISNVKDLHIDAGSNVGHRKKPLRDALQSGELVLYKEKAHQGFDLHLFSMDNIYRSLFFPLKELLSDQFRFFSINGKRIQSERKFYFETWALERPPHGVEEVFEETVL